MDACTRPHVNNIIRLPDGLLIMLNHKDRIPDVSKPFQRFKESQIIPLVESYTRFIQDVQHPHKARSYLSCKPDALTFAA